MLLYYCFCCNSNTITYVFSIVNLSELRPDASLPVFFGLIFGIVGALGSTIWNLITDIIAGYPADILIIGFIAQFIFGYLPYKLWYNFDWGNGMTTSNFKAVKNLIKYIIIILINSFIITMVVGYLAYLSDFNGIKYSTFIVFFNSFEFSMILGIIFKLYLIFSRHQNIYLNKLSPLKDLKIIIIIKNENIENILNENKLSK